jgi:CRP-like cAMP-binding protein
MLRDNALFSGVEGASLARALSVFRTVTVPADTPLYVSGQRATHLYLIDAGSVAVTQRTGGVETVVTVLGPGEFTGERALLDPRTRHLWSAVCSEESRIAFAVGDDVLAALTAFPTLGVNVAAALHRRVNDASLAIDELIADR